MTMRSPRTGLHTPPSSCSAEGEGHRRAHIWYRYPRAVRCSITGYGSTGPKAKQPGYDFVLQAECGLMHITGPVDGAPLIFSTPVRVLPDTYPTPPAR